ncbi:MAG TPA: SDR family NAD(P)-dependent oxidoreductase [Acidobacteriaceae bacterium]|jgi:3-oxoacyl-[acyl-carrier protein] reductase|nr:SDR family NAD(P)-dependent oxidoreductase [Acidobacteriaceae bacterium]
MTNKESDKGVSLSLAGKVALITGGSRGIGAATVRLFTAAGAKVVFNYRASQKEAEQLAAECGGPERCVAVHRDLSAPAHGRSLVEDTVRTFGRLDCLVANHGIWPPVDAPIDQMTDNQWHHTIHVNLDSVFGLVQAAVAQIRKQGRPAPAAAAGHIVLVSSTAGQRGEANHSDYAASKGALISFTKSLSSELIREGIYANSVAPGWVDTDMSAAALHDPATRDKIFAVIPAGRVATAEEIAGPILFLCTPFAGFISGEVFNVNGGAVLVG